MALWGVNSSVVVGVGGLLVVHASLGRGTTIVSRSSGGAVDRLLLLLLLGTAAVVAFLLGLWRTAVGLLGVAGLLVGLELLLLLLTGTVVAGELVVAGVVVCGGGVVRACVCVDGRGVGWWGGVGGGFGCHFLGVEMG